MAGGVIYLTVDFTAEAGTQTSATLERGPSAVGPWTFLREITLLGEIGTTYDTTVPLDTPVWYRWTSDLGDVEIQGPFTELSNGSVFLKDPVRPWANLELTFCEEGPVPVARALCDQAGPDFVWVAHGTKTRRVDAGLFDRLDAQTPADVYARRKRLDGAMTFFSKTLAGMDDVDALFDAGGPLQLQMPPAYGWRDSFIQPGDLNEDYISSDQSLPFRLWNAPFTIVDSSAAVGPIQGTECANWCFVDETWGTFADMTAAGGTWGDIAAGTTQCPPGGITPTLTDTFTRVVADAWGTADTGQTWTTSGGTLTNYDVDGTRGIHTVAVLGTSMNSLIPYPSADAAIKFDWTVDQVPTGDGHLVFGVIRAADSNNLYAARVRVEPTTGNLTLTLRKRVAGVETQLTTFATGLVYVAGTQYTTRFRVDGVNLMAKVWLTSGPEPAGWQTTTTDADIAAASNVGVRSVVGSGVTSPLPVTFTYDNFTAVP